MTKTLPAPAAAFTLAAAFALAGCVSFGAKPPASLLTLDAQSTVAVGKPVTATTAQAISVLAPSVPAALATTRVPVRSGTNQLAYLKDTAWVEQPGRLFQRLLSETIGARTGRAVLNPRDYDGVAGTRLSGDLQNFGLDATRMEAVVTFDAVLRREGDAATVTRRFEARVPVSEAKAGPVGRGLNEAANKVADEVVAWLG